MRTLNLVALTLLIILVSSALAETNQYEYKSALKTSQDVLGKEIGNYSLVDSEGRHSKLADLRGKPMVLSMIYTSCYQICPMTTRHLAKVVEKAREALGEDSFTVVSIGFDTTVDTPEAMAYFGKIQGLENANWKLFSMSADEAEALIADVGLVVYPSANGFDHIIQATVIDADGRIYRQVYGQVFETPLLVEPLKDLVLGRPQPQQTFLSELFNKVKLFCTVYDPVRDGYFFDYSLFIGIFIGAAIILLASFWLFREWRHRRRSIRG